MTEIIPDVAEKIIAVRAWDVALVKDARKKYDYLKRQPGLRGYCLESVGQRGVYWGRGENEAECAHGGHLAPTKGCSCGFWGLLSVATLEERLNLGTNDTRIVGTIEMWGRVVPADFGWRGQFAKIRTIVAPHPRASYRRNRWARWAASNYEVPLVYEVEELSPPMEKKGFEIPPEPPLPTSITTTSSSTQTVSTGGSWTQIGPNKWYGYANIGGTAAQIGNMTFANIPPGTVVQNVNNASHEVVLKTPDGKSWYFREV